MGRERQLASVPEIMHSPEIIAQWVEVVHESLDILETLGPAQNTQTPSHDVAHRIEDELTKIANGFPAVFADGDIGERLKEMGIFFTPEREPDTFSACRHPLLELHYTPRRRQTPQYVRNLARTTLRVA